MTAKKKKRLSGAAALKARGEKAILVGVPEADVATLKRAAELTRRPVSVYVAVKAVEAARADCAAAAE